MYEYTLLFADPGCEPRAISFEADRPAQALTIAQRRNCASHLFKEGAYLCTLERTGSFWTLRNDPVAARKAMVPPFASATVAPFLGRGSAATTTRPGPGGPVGTEVDRNRPGRALSKGAEAHSSELDACVR